MTDEFKEKNGKQLAAGYKDAFIEWQKGMEPIDYKQMVNPNGDLNRTEIMKVLGCSRSAVYGKVLSPEIIKLEDSLREQGILPSKALSEPEEGDDTTEKAETYDQNAKKRAMSDAQVTKLEQDNLQLQARITELEKELSRLEELREYVPQMGRCPR